jgi:hypothetical protein
MPSIYMPAFDDFPEEGAAIGRLVVGYGELEFQVAVCLNSVLRDADTTFRAMFRLRSESQKLDVADALMRPKFTEIGLAKEYATGFAAVDRCRLIRNQYAHCHWLGFGMAVQFTNLEPIAKKKEGKMVVRFQDIDLALLQKQEEYFGYAYEWLRFLSHEADLRAKLIEKHDHQRPKPLPAVKLNSSPPRPRLLDQVKA